MSTFVSLILAYRYEALLPLAFLEGPILAIAIGFLISQGTLEILPSFAILVFADAVRDILSYWIGRLGLAKVAEGRFKGRVESFRHLWMIHTWKAVVLSKWAYGLNFPMILSAGIVGVDFQKFLRICLLVTSFQYACLMTIGFFFGHSYALIHEYIVASQIFVSIIVVGLILLMTYLSRKAQHTLTQPYPPHSHQ